MMTGGATPSRWLIVVRRDKHDLYANLLQSFEPDGRVDVILDRRQADPWMESVPLEANWRAQQRRKADRRASVEDGRRRRQRRKALTAKERGLWQNEGFILAHRGNDFEDLRGQ